MRRSQAPARILIAQKFASLGGAQQSLVHQLELLDRQRFEPLVLVASSGWLTDQLDRLAVRWQRMPFGRWSNLKGLPGNLLLILRLWRLIRRERIELVHANEHWIAPPCLIAARLAGVPAVCHFRTGLEDLTPARIRKYLYRHFDRVLPVAEVLRRRLVEHLPDPSRVLTVRDGVVARGVPTPRRGRRSRTILLNIGAIYAVKGQALILERALPWLQADRRHFLVFVGGTRKDSDYLAGMRDSVAAAGLQRQVLFLGVRDDTERLLDLADALVAYSTVEGIPRVVMEAMLMARPVLVSNTPGMNEVVSDGVVGRIVDFDDPANALDQALRDLDARPEHWRAMGAEGRRQALAGYTTEAMTRQIEQVYAQLLGHDAHG